MNKLFKWIRSNWTDPVWSKVFSAIIISVGWNIILIMIAIWKRIPFSKIYTQTYSYLVNTSFNVNLLTIAIIISVLLIIVVPIIWIKPIKNKLMSIPFPNLVMSKFDLQTFLNGTWKCDFENSKLRSKGTEPVVLNNGNQYVAHGQLTFILTDIGFDEEKKELKWTKTKYPSNPQIENTQQKY